MKKALIFGAGNIGRGFMGQLFSQSGYEVVFADINESLIEAINMQRSYPISIVSNQASKEIIVKPVRGIDSRDTTAISAEMLESDLIATAVGSKALENVAKAISAGLKKRWERGIFRPINVIICENMLNPGKYMENIIRGMLNPKEQIYFNETVGLVEASVGRMIPVANKEQDGSSLRVFVEEYDLLPVDKEGFKGNIPNIINMIPYSPFIYYIHRKLFMHNMAHAITAYLGAYKCYKYIWESIADPIIRKAVINAFEESGKAIAKEYKRPLEELIYYAKDLIERFGNRALGDTTERVARDPIRKLAANDRLSGAAILCTRHDINPVHICLGIAAGLLYKSPTDKEANMVQKYIADKGVKEAIIHFCSFEPGDIKHQLVLRFYNQLKDEMRLEAILSTILEVEL